MVNKPNTPVPPAPTGLKSGPKQEAPQLATTATYSPKYSPDASSSKKDPVNADKTGENKFKLPEKLTPAEIRDGSFRYGGSRSSGNRSLEANKDMQKRQP
jgi:hypothetical protein